jgi:hypothetical protein
MRNKYLVGLLAGFALGVTATLPIATSGVQADRPLTERAYPMAPHVLSENVQRIARDEQIWRRAQFPTVESYVDFLALADQVAKQRFTRQMQRREGGADIDEEYRATLVILCAIPIPGKPPRYNEILEPFRRELALTAFTSLKARQDVRRRIKADAYEMPADLLKSQKELTPEQFFLMR